MKNNFSATYSLTSALKYKKNWTLFKALYNSQKVREIYMGLQQYAYLLQPSGGHLFSPYYFAADPFQIYCEEFQPFCFITK